MADVIAGKLDQTGCEAEANADKCTWDTSVKYRYFPRLNGGVFDSSRLPSSDEGEVGVLYHSELTSA